MLRRHAVLLEAASVTPWKVAGLVDYNRLVDQFGTQLLSPELELALSRGGKADAYRFHNETHARHLRRSSSLSPEKVVLLPPGLG